LSHNCPRFIPSKYQIPARSRTCWQGHGLQSQNRLMLLALDFCSKKYFAWDLDSDQGKLEPRPGPHAEIFYKQELPLVVWTDNGGPFRNIIQVVLQKGHWSFSSLHSPRKTLSEQSPRNLQQDSRHSTRRPKDPPPICCLSI